MGLPAPGPRIRGRCQTPIADVLTFQHVRGQRRLQTLWAAGNAPFCRSPTNRIIRKFAVELIVVVPRIPCEDGTECLCLDGAGRVVGSGSLDCALDSGIADLSLGGSCRQVQGSKGCGSVWRSGASEGVRVRGHSCVGMPSLCSVSAAFGADWLWCCRKQSAGCDGLQQARSGSDVRLAKGYRLPGQSFLPAQLNDPWAMP